LEHAGRRWWWSTVLLALRGRPRLARRIGSAREYKQIAARLAPSPSDRHGEKPSILAKRHERRRNQPAFGEVGAAAQRAGGSWFVFV
jgi:hypothetical protein